MTYFKKDAKERIEYIDLSKGICIVLVVLYHTCQIFHYSQSNTLFVISSFRMPLYFILSGLFFKEYNGFFDFSKRKINKLLIPFFSFYVILSIGLPVLLDFLDNNLSIVRIGGYFSGWIKGHFFNAATWFLLALFMTNIIFYIIVSISRKTKKYIQTTIMLSSLAGLIGCILSFHKINIPLYTDSALTVAPFFCFGYILRKYTRILYPNKLDKYNYLIITILLLTLYIPYTLSQPMAGLRTNTINCNPLLMYLCGISGTMIILLLSKHIKRIPYISYIGRYSIMILLTHYALLKLISKYLLDKIPHNLSTCIIAFLLVLTISSLFIPIFCKYLPTITAQKDMLK